MIARVPAATLTAAETAALDNLCKLAGSGQVSKVRAAERRICYLVVKDSGLPSAAALAAEQSCDRPAQST
jgi:hypothetical protein